MTKNETKQMIQLTFDVRPMAKQSYRNTRSGHRYLDPKVTKYRDTIRYLCKKQIPPGFKPIDTGVWIYIKYSFQYPKSFTKAVKTAIDEGNLILEKTTRPDIDNLTKAMLDALNGIVWVDDALVCSCLLEKEWAAENMVTVKIWQAPHEELKQ